jgi:hypothetical protein
MIKRFAAWFVGASLLGVALTGCGGSTVVQCRIDAVRALPEDENEISIGAIIELEHKLLGCRAPVVVPDGGPPK